MTDRRTDALARIADPTRILPDTLADTSQLYRAYYNLRIYFATSASNHLFDDLLAQTRAAGHTAYDFRASGRGPFFDTALNSAEYVTALRRPAADVQFNANRRAIDECDCLVLLTPCGNDAHNEAGYAHGRNIPVIVYLAAGFRAGLMHKFFNGFVDSIPDLLWALTHVVSRDAAATRDITSSALDPFPAWRYAV
jgi:hypothetical protein